MPNENSRRDLDIARTNLVGDLPDYLSLEEKKALRDFFEGVMDLRADEAVSGFELNHSLRLCDYVPFPHSNFLDLMHRFRSVFEFREIASTYLNNPEGFREYWDFVGTEYEQDSSVEELAVAWASYVRHGFAGDWETSLEKFLDALGLYWGEDVDSSSLCWAIRETAQVLCWPIFREEVASPLLSRWPAFSDKFRAILYSPRKPDSFHLRDLNSDELIF